jgi:hypothetical protein
LSKKKKKKKIDLFFRRDQPPLTGICPVAFIPKGQTAEWVMSVATTSDFKTPGGSTVQPVQADPERGVAAEAFVLRVRA